MKISKVKLSGKNALESQSAGPTADANPPSTQRLASDLPLKARKPSGDARAPRADASALEHRPNEGSSNIAGRMNLKPRAPSRPVAIFDDSQQKAIKGAEHVVVAGYSSTGAGHTERMFNVLRHAIGAGDITSKDVIVLQLPMRWPHDKGAAERSLTRFLDELKSQQIHCISVQGDKTITGYYSKAGDSDNHAILEKLTSEPQRNVPDTVPAILSETATAYPSRDIVGQIVKLAGGTEKLHVLSDMAPNLTKAASQSGCENLVEIGNHHQLADRRVDHQGRSLAYLPKMNASGYAEKIGLIGYLTDANPVAGIQSTIEQFAIKPTTTARQAREQIFQHVLDNARRNSLDIGVKPHAGILVKIGHGARQIDRAVFLYVNEYTLRAVDHARQRLHDAAPGSAWDRTMIAVCAAKAFGEDRPGNILHMMYLAQADGLMNAGFGTTSEALELVVKGHSQANVGLLPVTDQREQQANAREVLRMGGDQFIGLDDGSKLGDALDRIVESGTTTDALQGTMAAIVQTVGNPRTNSEHIAGMLFGEEHPSVRETRLLAAGRDLHHNPDSKAMRRMAKLLFPLLQATAQGQAQTTVRMTHKAAPQPMTLDKALSVLKDTRQLAATLRIPNAQSPEVASARERWIGNLSRLSEVPAGTSEHEQQARRLLDELVNGKPGGFVVGF